MRIRDADRISNNVAGQYKRGVAIAIQVIFGNSGGAIASNVYRVRDAPRYLLGRKLALFGVFTCALTRVY